jgi:hypothetical protein
VLHLRGKLPVVVLQVVTAQRIRDTTRTARADLTEGQVRPPAALAVRRRIPQVAIGNVVAAARIAGAERRVVPGALRAVGLIVRGNIDGGNRLRRVASERGL